MKMKTLTGLLAASTIFASGAAMADPFYINVGAFDTPRVGLDGKTGVMDELQLNVLATSTYTDLDANGVDFGDTVVDSGKGTVGGFLLNGTNLSGGQNLEGLNDDIYKILVQYSDLTGVVQAVDATNPLNVGIGAKYSSGTIHVYSDTNLDDIADEEILTLSVFSSTGTIANALIFANVTFAKDDTWFFPPSTDWSDLTVAIQMTYDTNVFGPAPTATGKPNEFARTSTLNGSATFAAVPEPSVLALLGIGLVGLGVGRRAKKQRA